MGPPVGGNSGGKLPPNQQRQQQQQPYYNQGRPSTQNQPPENTAPREQYPNLNNLDERPSPETQQHQYSDYEQRGPDNGYGPMASASAIPRPQTVPSSHQQGARGRPNHDFDETDRGNISVNVPYQEEGRVTDATQNILLSFIVGRMDSDGLDVPTGLRRRQGGNNDREIAQVLQRIGDEMSNHAQLNRLITEICVTPDTVCETFFSVALKIFADGTINWGRICTLFYFAYKLAIQVLNELPLVDIIIDWVKRFVAQKLAAWILDKGGWTAVKQYFGAPPCQLFLVFFAGVGISSMFWYWKK